MTPNTGKTMDAPGGSAAEPPRVLHLTLHRRWFDEIAAGRKKEEYRQRKPFWKKRFYGSLDSSFPTIYDEVWFRNGYSLDKPFMRVEWRGLKPNAEFNGEAVYAIQLGDILEIRNYEAPEAPQGRGEPLGEPSPSSPSPSMEAQP